MSGVTVLLPITESGELLNTVMVLAGMVACQQRKLESFERRELQFGN